MTVGTSGFSQADLPRAAVPFRYRFTASRVAATTVDIGHVGVTVALTLSGDMRVLVSGPRARSRARALAALREVATGVMVGGIGSSEPRVSATAGHRFTQTGRAFHAPDTVSFTGRCAVDFTRAADGDEVAVSGAAGYRLDVSAQSHHEPALPPWDGSPDARTWFSRHDHELSAIGMVVLVAVPVAPGPLVSAA